MCRWAVNTARLVSWTTQGYVRLAFLGVQFITYAYKCAPLLLVLRVKHSAPGLLSLNTAWLTCCPAGALHALKHTTANLPAFIAMPRLMLQLRLNLTFCWLKKTLTACVFFFACGACLPSSLTCRRNAAVDTQRYLILHCIALHSNMCQFCKSVVRLQSSPTKSTASTLQLS